MTDTDLTTRFWLKVDRSGGPDACWPWMAGLFTNGYGQFWLRGTNRKAHRVALELSGVIIPHGMSALHHCDNRRCCNTSHLYVGTHHDNMRDMVARGRQASRERNFFHQHPEITRGTNNANAVLSPQDIMEIRDLSARGLIDRRMGGSRRASDINLSSLAKRYGVQRCAIASVLDRRTWKHL